jgi:hypothetical protein
MTKLPSPASKRFKHALTILESLILLVTASALALVAVPVVLEKKEIIKREPLPLVTAPPTAPSNSGSNPAPQPELPKAPNLPSPPSLPSTKDN